MNREEIMQIEAGRELDALAICRAALLAVMESEK